MYSSYNTSNKTINKSKKYTWYNLALNNMNNMNEKPIPITLPPLNINYANKVKNSYKYNTTVNYFDNKLRPSITHYPGSIAKNPYLNPMFNFNYEPSETTLNTLCTNKIVTDYNENNTELDDEVDDDLADEVDDELEYQYSQRKWIKNNSKNCEIDMSHIPLKLIRGDVVNIDKKTLVFQSYDSNSKRHVFKELTTLKMCDYDLKTRPYNVVIPSKLKYDIITPKNIFREITYTDEIKLESTQLTEGYLSDLENGNNKLPSIPETPLNIISDYVTKNRTIESVYNIQNTTSVPKIIIHQDDSNDQLEKLASETVDNIIKDVVTEINNRSKSNIKDSAKTNCEENTDVSTIKVDLSEDDATNGSWGGWCSIS